MNTYVCRKLRLYNFLTQNGFKPFRICADKYNPDRLIWLYTDSVELRDAIEDYYSRF